MDFEAAQVAPSAVEICICDDDVVFPPEPEVDEGMGDE
jgi:hypothetical protein